MKCFHIEIHAPFKNLSCFQRKLLENITKGVSATERNKLYKKIVNGGGQVMSFLFWLPTFQTIVEYAIM